MSELLKVTESMMEEVLPIFAEFNSPPADSPLWKNLFHLPWEVDEDCRGYALFDRGKVTGFIGTIFSTRKINGKLERFCNISSFVTLSDYRSEALKLLVPLMGLKDYTITCFTPSDVVHTLFRKLGFQNLDETMHILLPLPEACKMIGNMGKRLELTTSEEGLEARLNPEHRAIHQAHRLFGCQHLLISEKDQSCYIVFNRTQGRKRSFSYIHYLSNPSLFFTHLNGVKMKMARMSRTPFIMLMDRYTGGFSLGWKRTTSIRIPAVFKSTRLERSEIDSLYSELQLLDI